ncbi:hypothetical protein RhiJN_27132 [Ceratobasidium sp. AG-Ba]|nr:hypothetical protein RhiJN_27132 [Ceratobasidium sp. AG-Ba]
MAEEARLRDPDDATELPTPYGLADSYFFQAMWDVYSSHPRYTVTSGQWCNKFHRVEQGQEPETHVLLAACKGDEEATCDYSEERKTSGLFTYTLVRTLRECDMATTSYSMLMEHVQKCLIDAQIKHSGVATQTPQCKGKYKNRLIYRTQYAPPKTHTEVGDV